MKRKNDILELIRESKKIKSKDISRKLNVSSSTLKRDLTQLKRNNLIEFIGTQRYGYWVLKNLFFLR
ncbi:HTH domain-containing protein [Psittacicella melopsittaci]|uniref:HTH domain-containing protein n=1 Tax=Psittacicella melopsittaci TaxID=2028576 RepID=UPI001CA647A5